MNARLNFLVLGRTEKKGVQEKKWDERNGRLRNLSDSVFLTFSNCTIPQVNLTTTLLFLLSLLSAPFLSGSGEAENRDIFSPSTPLHNPGNILSLCSQPSGDLAILASGSAVAIARWPKCLLWLTHPAKVVHTLKGQYSRALLFPARLVCEQLTRDTFSWAPSAI